MIMNILEKIPNINPSNNLKLTWDALLSILCMLIIFLIPIHIIY